MTTGPDAATRSVRAARSLAYAAVVAALALRVVTSRSWPFWDLDVYLAGAQALSGHADLYAVEAHGLFFTYPPFAAVLFLGLQPLAAFTPWVVSILSLSSLAVVVLVLARRLGLSGSTTVLLGVAALAVEPVSRTLVLGQVNLLLMALVVVDVFVVPKRFQGLLVGVAAGIKLTPAVFIVYFLARREWGAAARAAAGGALTVVVGWLVAPGASQTYWTGRVLETGGFGDFQIQAANQSVRGVLIRVLGTPSPPVAVWGVIVVVIAVAAFVNARRQAGRRDDVGALVGVAVAGLLSSPISWTHHWVWIVPLLMYACSRRWFLAAWLLGVLFVVAPMWFVPSGGGIELHYSVAELVVSSAYVLAGAGYLVAVMTADRASRHAPHR